MVTFCYKDYKIKNWDSIDDPGFYVYSKHNFKTVSFLYLLISVDMIHEQISKTQNIKHISSIVDC